jgi:glycosyltransferase involved in cell wall biosynthesis
VRLAVARLLGYRIVWTIHQVYPHETADRDLDRRAALTLARRADLLLALDAATADSARAELGQAARTVHVIPHGSYLDVYPPGRPRSTVRAELGIADDAFVFLHFGLLRAYKDVDLLLAAFESADVPNGILVIAGFAQDKELSHLLARRAREPRIRLYRGFVPVERVAELYDACDAAVLPRSDGGTSGSLVLALSMSTPVIAADTRTYRDLTDEGDAGWLFRPGDVSSLRFALEQAGRDPEEGRRRGAIAGLVAARLDWEPIAEQTAALLRGIAP